MSDVHDSRGEQVATVVGLRRHPVKSMGGDPVERAELGPRGLLGDRTWAVRELERDTIASARTLPELLQVQAAYVDGASGAVRLVLPDGRETGSDDPTVHDLLSDLVGTSVRLEALADQPDAAAHRTPMRSLGALRREFALAPDEPLPDLRGVPVRTLLRAARYATPPGSFVDVAAVHLLSAASASRVGADPRRFRPTVLVEVTEGATEQDWVGRELSVGGARLQVTMPTVRCSIPTRAQVDLDADSEVMRRVSRDHGRVLGVYADVLDPGPVAVGDAVVVHDATPAPTLGRAVAGVRDAAYRLARRVPLGSGAPGR